MSIKKTKDICTWKAMWTTWNEPDFFQCQRFQLNVCIELLNFLKWIIVENLQKNLLKILILINKFQITQEIKFRTNWPYPAHSDKLATLPNSHEYRSIAKTSLKILFRTVMSQRKIQVTLSGRGKRSTKKEKEELLEKRSLRG